jgi:large subunit ribosomal protein L9
VSATVTANVARSTEEAAEQERLGHAILSIEMQEAEDERVAALAEAEAIFEPEAIESAAAELAETEEPDAPATESAAPTEGDAGESDENKS